MRAASKRLFPGLGQQLVGAQNRGQEAGSRGNGVGPRGRRSEGKGQGHAQHHLGVVFGFHRGSTAGPTPFSWRCHPGGGGGGGGLRLHLTVRCAHGRCEAVLRAPGPAQPEGRGLRAGAQPPGGWGCCLHPRSWGDVPRRPLCPTTWPPRLHWPCPCHDQVQQAPGRRWSPGVPAENMWQH